MAFNTLADVQSIRPNGEVFVKYSGWIVYSVRVVAIPKLGKAPTLLTKSYQILEQKEFDLVSFEVGAKVLIAVPPTFFSPER